MIFSSLIGSHVISAHRNCTVQDIGLGLEVKSIPLIRRGGWWDSRKPYPQRTRSRCEAADLNRQPQTASPQSSLQPEVEKGGSYNMCWSLLERLVLRDYPCHVLFQQRWMLLASWTRMILHVSHWYLKRFLQLTEQYLYRNNWSNGPQLVLTSACCVC